MVDATFIEDGEPVTSSEKRLPLATPLYDVMRVNRTENDVPPTMVVSELIDLLIAPKQCSQHGVATAWQNPDLSDDMVARLGRIFQRYATGTDDATGEAVMTVPDVERWLIAINGQVGRGDEFRQAARQMGWSNDDDNDPDARITELPANGVLTLQGFVAVYEAELRAGKFWGIAHDMAVLGDALPITQLYTARYDRMYASAAVQTTAIMEFLSDRACPNEWEPSDHLPIAASFTLQSTSK